MEIKDKAKLANASRTYYHDFPIFSPLLPLSSLSRFCLNQLRWGRRSRVEICTERASRSSAFRGSKRGCNHGKNGPLFHVRSPCAFFPTQPSQLLDPSEFASSTSSIDFPFLSASVRTLVDKHTTIFRRWSPVGLDASLNSSFRTLFPYLLDHFFKFVDPQSPLCVHSNRTEQLN